MLQELQQARFTGAWQGTAGVEIDRRVRGLDGPGVRDEQRHHGSLVVVQHDVALRESREFIQQAGQRRRIFS